MKRLIHLGPLVVLLLAGAGEAPAQECLGTPVEAGETSLAGRLDLDVTRMLTAELTRAGEQIAWSLRLGGSTAELIPPAEFNLAVGAGVAYTGLRPWICPALSIVTAGEEVEGFSVEPGDASARRTEIRVGVGLSGRLRETGSGMVVFVHPHLRVQRVDERFGDLRADDSRSEWWVEGGLTLSGERFFGLAALALQIADYSPGEDILGGSSRFALGFRP